MGLFKRRPSVDPAELESVRAELADMRSRLVVTEREKAIVDNRLASLDAAAASLGTRASAMHELEQRLDEIDAKLAPVVTAPDLAPRIDELHQQLAVMAHRLDEPVAAPSAPVEREAIDALDDKVNDIAGQLAAIDSLTLQLNQLNVRVLTQDDLGDQLGHLRHQLMSTQALVDRVDVLEAKVTDTHVAEPDLQPVHNRIDELERRIADARPAEPDLHHVYARLDALDARTLEPTPTPDLGDIYRRIAELEASVPEVASLDEILTRIADVGTQAQAAREHTDVLDHRLTGISTELANQLAELSGEIDEVGTRTPSSAPPPADSSGETDEAISALRSTQIRLAAEQARYEIAFREDLAALADQLRRPTRT